MSETPDFPARGGVPAEPTPAPTPTPGPTTPEPTRRGWTRPGRRQLLLIAIPVVVALVAGGVTAGVFAHRAAEERAAVAEAEADLSAAERELDEARTRADDAEAEHTAALERMSTASAALTAATGAADGLGADDALVAAATEQEEVAALMTAPAAPAAEDAEHAEDPVAEKPVTETHETESDTAETDDPKPSTPAGMRSAAADLDDATAALSERSAAMASAADELEAAGTALGSAVAASGTAILADRADAGAEVLAALEAQTQVVAQAPLSELGAAITAYRGAADAVVQASDKVRTPARPPAAGGAGSVVGDPASLTVVVNKRRALPADFTPPGLVMPNLPNTNGQPLRQEAASALEQMAAAAAAEGIQLRIASAYRSYATQKSIYGRNVAGQGQAQADTHSARPGHSEHQTGLAVDLDDGACSIQTCFADRPGGQWLAANAWRWGFILRYGAGWQPIVGYMYEPWHYRFVGTEVAGAMHSAGTRTLEEHFGLPAAPDYG